MPLPTYFYAADLLVAIPCHLNIPTSIGMYMYNLQPPGILCRSQPHPKYPTLPKTNPLVMIYLSAEYPATCRNDVPYSRKSNFRCFGIFTLQF